MPRLFPRTLYGTSFWARFLFEHCACFRPVHRVAAWMSAQGLTVSPGTLADSLKRFVPLLEPLAEAILAHQNKAALRHADETSWRVQELRGEDRSSRAWLWVSVSNDAVSFHIDPSRSAEAAQKLFAEGLLDTVIVCDRYSAYKRLARLREGKVTLAFCWSHMRRDFVECAAGQGRVEEGRGGLYRIGITPFPFPAHQTGRANFPHPAFRLASSRGTRRGAKMNPAQPKHAEIPEHGPSREPRGAARRHLVTPDQKMPHALIDVIVDRSIGRQARPVAEVVRPAAQHAVQLVAHLGPGCLVAGPQEPSDFQLEPSHALPGRARPQIPVAILAKALRAEAIAQEVDAVQLSLRPSRTLVLASFRVSPSRVITCRVQAKASLACPRLRMTRSSA